MGTMKTAYYNLGSFHRPVTTASKDTQTWFDRGLVWCFGFNLEEAVKCFEKAVGYDSGCAMAWWGLAFALGPHYNKPWAQFDEKELKETLERIAHAVENAEKCASKSSPVEQALVKAIKVRHPRDLTDKGYDVCSRAYADAMALVHEQFSDDLDVSALFADALMILTPWELWDIRTGEPAPRARTLEAKSVLERGLNHATGYSHPGLLHLYIHLMEMSTTPEVAVKAADHLRELVPESGHLLHMPSHIDILIGDYRRAVSANARAIVADEKNLALSGGNDFYTFYRVHDYHTLIYAAMFAGQMGPAMSAASRLEASMTEEFLRTESPPMADWVESLCAVRMHIYIRFGRWKDILQAELPRDATLYSVTTAVMHYAKGVAWAATGHVDEAEKEQGKFHEAIQCVQPSRMEYPNKCSDILEVAKAMLDGEIAYRRGNYHEAFKQLETAVALDDSLIYCEPWGWMQPTRHALAALLLEQGHVERAAGIYAADLGFDDTLPRARQHPNNVWALHGYHESLLRLGRIAEAHIVKQQLTLALAVADVNVSSSCFCRSVTDSCCSK